MTPGTPTPIRRATTPGQVVPTGTATTLHGEVSTHYGRIARAVLDGAPAPADSCCGGGGCCTPGGDAITRDLYVRGETDELPSDAVLASLGCGNPTALAELAPGETVLDLGSGGGIDVLLSARRVGPNGFAYGVDMTDDMLALARRNAEAAGVTNVAFRRGHIEELPFDDESIDVIISNCVVNLSGDKAAVAREAFRVLRPGGRFAVSDVVTRGELPAAVRENPELWSGCVAGALSDATFTATLTAAGFTDVSVEFTRTYTHDDLLSLLAGFGPAAPALADAMTDRLGAAFVRARKPSRDGTEP